MNHHLGTPDNIRFLFFCFVIQNLITILNYEAKENLSYVNYIRCKRKV